jgi:hypothetical protein
MIVLTLFTLQATELANKFKETFWSRRMNERIQKLVRQADSYAVGKMAEIGGQYFDYYNEKFAELIVRECSQMVVNSHPDDLPFVGGKMLVHFGVEE